MFQNRMDNRFIIVSLLNANRFIHQGAYVCFAIVFQCLETKRCLCRHLNFFQYISAVANSKFYNAWKRAEL